MSFDNEFTFFTFMSPYCTHAKLDFSIFKFKSCTEKLKFIWNCGFFQVELTRGFLSLQNKDEKIMSLEAENAVLHLRMSKLMHQLQIQAEKITFLSSRIQEQLKERRQWKGSVFSLYTKFLVVFLFPPHFQNFTACT